LKILVYLLARKAMVALGFDLGAEGAAASAIALAIDVSQDTVSPGLRKMHKEGILEQAKDSKYFVPNHAVVRIKGMFGTQ
jgi:DNA-binding IclR family transcriptional regulator